MSDKLDKYIQGKLSEEDRQSFESQMSPEEREDAAFELGVKSEIERDVLRAKVSEFESRRSTGLIRRYIGIAASVILIASFSYVILSDKSDLYDQYYSGYANFEHTVVRGEMSESLKDQAYRAYDLGQFELSVSIFQDLIAKDPANIPAHFFRGMSLMEIGKFEEAINSFEVVVRADSEYKEAALWYSALGFVKIGNQAKARIFLNQLIDSEEYAGKADTLRKEL